ncbi:hypothetical protein RhiirA4_461425 [Rhizophagus irregularis]|uniref:Uncharacterized protein n=1 Tax=Rhizophagus irregularis TaxID=588596 RepID=A0A2I1GIT3_9GLOM|nr:hypothetical protein RhiirA4_461425 [Rhizophagus irregularis]
MSDENYSKMFIVKWFLYFLNVVFFRIFRVSGYGNIVFFEFDVKMGIFSDKHGDLTVFQVFKRGKSNKNVLEIELMVDYSDFFIFFIICFIGDSLWNFATKTEFLNFNKPPSHNFNYIKYFKESYSPFSGRIGN